ncbi:uncharacterized protein LOC135094333 isoform X1 [Scylla paramamosain]|uniref:uncharacterized protein LOC135091148 isoform X3 n=2 Tax=Scylla paramamosain TaxID=85552 RepID=UPI003083EB95
MTNHNCPRGRVVCGNEVADNVVLYTSKKTLICDHVQMNQVTAFIDASHTYGSDKCEQQQLSTKSDGMLRGTPNPLRGKDLLPTENENHECQAPSGRCFTVGYFGRKECTRKEA